MTKKLLALLLLTVLLSACTSSPTAAPAGLTQPASEALATEAGGSAPSANNDPASAEREAVLSEFENEVAVKATADGEYIPAVINFVLQQGGSLQTGETGRARLDLMPDGTIIRVAPNSAFTLPEITEADGAPKTGIDLFFGKIFVLLNGGSLDVQTPSGVASVRGSLLSVSYDPETRRVQAACLEGHCAIENEDGEEVELEEGESGFVDENGEIREFDGIDQEEIQEWLDEAPELDLFLEELPNPENYEQIEDFEQYEFDPALYYEQQPTDDGSGYYWSFDESTGGAPTQDPNEGAMEEPTSDPGGELPPPEEGTPDPTGGGG